MRLLVDTHVFLWAASASTRVTPHARDAMVSASEIYLSTVSLWEVMLEYTKGTLRLPVSLDVFFERQVAEQRLTELQVTRAHILTASRLPTVPRHRDPFDRMLVAQAISEGVPLVSSDHALDVYGVERLW